MRPSNLKPLALIGRKISHNLLSVSTSVALKAVHIDCWVERPCREAQEREGIAVLRSQCKVRYPTFSVDHKRNPKAHWILEWSISNIGI